MSLVQAINCRKKDVVLENMLKILPHSNEHQKFCQPKFYNLGIRGSEPCSDLHRTAAEAVAGSRSCIERRRYAMMRHLTF